MIVLAITDLSLPLTNPVLKFFLILVIILIAPLLLNKLRIPHLLGLIIAGAVIGPFGMNLLIRDSGIILSGTAGLLYIMFLAGLEIDLAEFRKNRTKSLVFGMYTFLIPMITGTLAGFFLLNMSFMASVLLASMFASHTLIAYPIISKLGLSKNRAVTTSVGGTMITDTLALLVLAIIVGMHTGEVNAMFWIRLIAALFLFAMAVAYILPMISRWFFKHFEDSVSQFIFVLVMLFLGAVLAEIAGIEAIIGAFMAGLALNRLIPRTSPLMNRIDFVGNAIFIPFFLIGVGMLIDYKVFFNDWETIKVAAVMTVVATLAKYSASYITQKTFGYTRDERRLIFGLSNAQAAATLAAVLIGYNVIIGTDEAGEPIRLLNDLILNGTIVMILITCTIASFQAQKGAQNVALSSGVAVGSSLIAEEEKILIPVSNPNRIEDLLNLSIIIKGKRNVNGFFAINIINNFDDNEELLNNAGKMLDKASSIAAAADVHLTKLLRYDLNIVNGIASVVKEYNITDLVLGLHEKNALTDSLLGDLTEGILAKSNLSTLIYRPVQPISTIEKHIVIVPGNAEKEVGFPLWLNKLWNIARNTGAKIIFYGTESSIDIIKSVLKIHPVNAEFVVFEDWRNLPELTSKMKTNENLILIMSRKNKVSYQLIMNNIADILNQNFRKHSFLLVYPVQFGVALDQKIDLTNAAMMKPIDDYDFLIKKISNLFLHN
jgi:Kef-type K+ transport system membrane component KefB